MVEKTGNSRHDERESRTFSTSSSKSHKIRLNKTSNELIEILTPEVLFAIGWNRFNLRMIGLWPEQTCKSSKASLITRYSSPIWGVWIFGFIVAPQAVSPIVYSVVLDEIIQVTAGVIGIVGAIVKIIVLWYNSEAWCLSFLIEDWGRKHSIRERELMMNNAKIGRNISIGFTILMNCLVFSYLALQAIPLINLNLNAENCTEIGKQLMYPSYFPFDLSKPSNFAFLWIGQLLATFTSTIAYTGSDSFIAMFIIHLCGQISIVRHNLMEILDDEKSVDPKTFRYNLAIIVRRHETLISYASVIEDTINMMLLVLILIYTAQFGLQLFGLMTAITQRKPGQFPFLQVLFSVSYLNVTIVHFYLYCYIGDMLIEESEALGLASYSCKWYKLSGRDAKDLLFLMHRAKLPLQISAGKFVSFSFELFGNVLKTSMSYFSVLLTMKEQLTDEQEW